MKSISVAIALAFVTAAELAAVASPVNTAVVPADAGAVIHVDLDAIKSSRLYALARVKLGKNPAAALIESEGDPLDAKGKLLVDALVSARAATIWVDGAGELGVAAFHGVDAARVTRALAGLPDHRTEKLGKRTLHRLGKGDDGACLLVEGSWLFIAEEPAAITRTLAVLDGTAPRLARARVEGGAAGGILLVAVLGDELLGKVAKQAQSSLLKGGLESARLVISERGDKLVGLAQVTMRSTDDAVQVEKLAAGLLAFGSLAADDDVSRRLVQGLTARRSDKVVSIDLQISHADLAKLMGQAP